MQERHTNRKQYFLEQGITTRKFVIPYIETIVAIRNNKRVLEIGCGEGGNIVPFVEMGCEVIGIDINQKQLDLAHEYIEQLHPRTEVSLVCRNIYEISASEIGKFDLIILRDVIEHIDDQDKFLGHLKQFLKPEGIVFFGFPPWRMPFGGHQQICRSKLLSKLPYVHLFPSGIYRRILKLFGESEEVIVELLDIQRTGIGIKRFETLALRNKYRFLKKTLYLINPNYEIKFGLKPREQYSLVKSIPVLRDFLTSCYYCVVKVDN